MLWSRAVAQDRGRSGTRPQIKTQSQKQITFSVGEFSITDETYEGGSNNNNTLRRWAVAVTEMDWKNPLFRLEFFVFFRWIRWTKPRVLAELIPSIAIRVRNPPFLNVQLGPVSSRLASSFTGSAYVIGRRRLMRILAFKALGVRKGDIRTIHVSQSFSRNRLRFNDDRETNGSNVLLRHVLHSRKQRIGKCCSSNRVNIEWIFENYRIFTRIRKIWI